MNRHSRLWGNDPKAAAGFVQRGQRVFCSNRGKRGGCGRTYSLMVCDVLPRHTVGASVLWKWVLGLLGGASVRAAAEGLPFALETFRALKVKLVRGMSRIRCRLMGLAVPPESRSSDPLLQTFEHLRVAFAGADQCPVAAFQMHFQVPFLG